MKFVTSNENFAAINKDYEERNGIGWNGIDFSISSMLTCLSHS